MKTKKVLALTLATAMCGGMIPGIAHAEEVQAVEASHIKSSKLEDFESYGTGVEGVSKFTGTSTSTTYKLGDYLEITVEGEGNSVEIAEDPYTQSKALKLTHTGAGKIEIANWVNNNTKKTTIEATDILKGGAKLRVDHYASDTWINRFNSFSYTSDWYGAARCVGYGDGFKPVNFDGTFANDISTNYNNQYLYTEMLYDYTGKLVDIKSQANISYSVEPPAETMAKIIYSITPATGGLGSNPTNYYGKGSADQDTVIWLDDLSFEIIDFSIKEMTIGGTVAATGMTDVPSNAPIAVNFSGEISDADLTNENFKVTDANGNAIKTEIKKESENAVYIYPNGQTAGQTYTVTVAKGIRCSANNAITISAEKSYSYTTSTDGLTFLGYIANANFNNNLDETTAEVNGIVDGNFKYLTKSGYKQAANDTMSVANEPTTNSPALKIYRPATGTGETRYIYNLPNAISEGKLVVTYDLRMAKTADAGSFMSFGTADVNGSNPTWQSALYNGYWTAFIGNALTSVWGSYSQLGTDYFPVMLSLDFRTKTIAGDVYRNPTSYHKTSSKTWTDELAVTNMAFINLKTAAEQEYYIDNFKIAHYGYKPLSVDAISIESSNVNTSKNIEITMNGVVDPEYLTKDYFRITNMDTETAFTDYELSQEGSKVIIKLNSRLEYDTTYALNVVAGVKSATASVKDMEADYMHIFRTNTKIAEKVVYTDNFEDIAAANPDGKKFSPTVYQWIAINDNIDIRRYKASDNIEWAYDEDEGKWGFKLTQVSKSSGDQLNFVYKFPKAYDDDKYLVKIDTKVDNHSSALYQWPGIMQSSNLADRSVKDLMFLYTEGQAHISRAAGDGVETGFTYTSKTPHTLMAVVDPGKNIEFGLDGKLATSNRAGAADLAGVRFTSYGATKDGDGAIYAGTDNDGTEANAAVMWIYGISVERVYFGVERTSFEETQEAFDPKNDISVKFNGELNETTVNKDNVLLYKNNELMAETDYMIELDETSRWIKVKSDNLEYESEYTLVIKKDVLPVNEAGGVLENDLTYTITTMAMPKKDFDTVDEKFIVEGTSITCSGVFENNTSEGTDINYYIALYKTDENGKEQLISVKKAEPTRVEAESSVNVSAVFTDVSDTDVYAKGFAWVGQTPLDEVTIFEVIDAIYVSANGSDANSGSLDSPFASLDMALDTYASSDKSIKDIVIMGGEYNMTETVNITSAHNGVTISEYGDGEVILKGSEVIPSSSFTKVTDDTILNKVGKDVRNNLYVADISSFDLSNYTEYAAQGSGTGYFDLYADGELKTLARWPNSGYAKIAAKISDTSFTTNESRSERWANSGTGMIFGYFANDWACQPIYITGADADTNVTLNKAPAYGIEAGKRYYAFNMIEELDIPGEYYIDVENEKLYYAPEKDIASTKLELTKKNNTFINISNAKNITIKDITVEMGRASAIVSNTGDNITISNVEIRNMGNSAISMAGGTKNIVENSEIYNIGGTGVSINSGDVNTLKAGNSVIRNNHIYNTGRTFKTYQPAVAIRGVGNKVLYNTIHDTPHMAVNYNCTSLEFAYNEVHDVVKEASDAGALYTGRNWINWGKNIHDNYFHDIQRNEELESMSVAVVYADDLFCGNEVKNNIFENCYMAMLSGGGSANRFVDNTLINCTKGVQFDNRGEKGFWGEAMAEDGEGTVYSNFVTALSVYESNNVLNKWISNFYGFETLYNDVMKKKAGDTEVDVGLPKNCKVYGNKHYGANVNDLEYINVKDSVRDNGDIRTDTELKETSVPSDLITGSYGVR